MKQGRKGKIEEALTLKVKHDPKLDKLTGTVLFPKKLEAANKVVSNLKWTK